MGRSPSCFKIIACGSDSAEKDDAFDIPENKRSSDRKGWSFRKRSEQQQVLSNTVIEEAPSGIKESAESAVSNFQQPDISVTPEKISTIQYTEEKPQLLSPKEYIEENSQLVAPKEYIEEKSQLLTPIEYTEEKSQLLTPTEYTEEKSQLLIPEDSKVHEPVSASTNEAEDDANLDESVVVIIQTAIRGFLAQKELGKLKNLVKLQAAVRGHLVRRHAVGTLRCVQAIVKVQVLVRARLSQEGSYAEKKLDHKNNASQSLKGSSTTKQNATYTSIEKLLSNRFARKLIDSTPKTKPIHIKCDPSKPNSAWSWLERWMSVSSSEKAAPADLPIEQREREIRDGCDSPIDAKVPSEAISESNEPKSDVRDMLVSSESEENLITYDATNFKIEACQPTSSSVTDDLEHPQIDNLSTSNLKETSQDQTMQTDAHPQTEDCLSHKPEIESEQPKRSMKRFASEQLETEAKKFVVFGSRKASNPAFIAAQTKFEELSLTANSSKSINSSHQDVGIESNMDTVSSGADTISRSKEPSITENPVLNNWRVEHCGSECGTELSVTSTFDSPDRSEVGTIEYEHVAKVSEQENCSSNSTKDLDVKENDSFAIPLPDSSLSVVEQPKKLDDAVGESANLIVVDSPQVEQKPLKSTSDLQRERDSETGNQTFRSSPEASPRSHMTVPESQGTPSSQVSVKTKKKRTDKSGQKRESLSAAKGSPSTPAHDSGASSMEQLSKDQENGKRCNSFGSTRPENIDEEPRVSNSSNSLPHFMQATESARAKVNANNSPRSSPDVQDKDIYIKKRRSLAGANGKQGSPRIQQSMSKAQQGAKGNGTNPLHEKRWQR
ncbi:protein IQ-DOMAIN 32-like [Durio zibethinus]|uniref:Protein IQ-DOMAIN 32-like n=1 Tax=Durio zibethinus TaxID=66656 RepID=A0A6P6B657_DURZI|nr:protein IQ-DOMAIN 32-like [Durio zibethinus]